MIKQMYLKTILFLATLLTITACGGSSDSSGNTVRDTTSTDTEETTDDNLERITGVYDVSRSNDEAYLYIDGDGNVEAYDYQGDLSGTGENCYVRSSSVEQINYLLDGGSITYSNATGIFTLTSGSATLTFTSTGLTGLGNFRLIANGITYLGDNSLDIETTGVNISIGTGNNKPVANISIADISGAICG